MPAFDPVTHKTPVGDSGSNWSTPASLITFKYKFEIRRAQSQVIRKIYLCPFRIRAGSIMCKRRVGLRSSALSLITSGGLWFRPMSADYRNIMRNKHPT